MRCKKQRFKAVLIFLTAILICLQSFAFAKEADVNAPTSSESTAIINLEGFAPADQITERDGVFEIGSNNIMDTVTNTLIQQGLVSIREEIKNMARTVGKKSEGSNPESQSIVTKAETAVHSPLDMAIQNMVDNVTDITILSANLPSDFQSGVGIQNGGTTENPGSGIGGGSGGPVPEGSA